VKDALLLLSCVLIFITSSVAYAQKQNDLLLSLTDCSSIANDGERLACFDTLVSLSARQSIVTVTTVEPLIVDNKPFKQNQVDEFAKEHLKKTREQQGPSSILATVSKVKQLLRGQWLIYLENGQKWQQTDTAKIKLKIGHKVRLKKGALGAVYLYSEGSNRSIKVKRLK
jgi:hypothetical protein